MKKRTLLGVLLMAGLFLIWSCDDDDPTNPSAISVSGNVTDASAATPIADVNVKSGVRRTITGSDGAYTTDAN